MATMMSLSYPMIKRLLKNVMSAGKTGQNLVNKKCLCVINTHYESHFNPVLPSAIVFRPPAKWIRVAWTAMVVALIVTLAGAVTFSYAAAGEDSLSPKRALVIGNSNYRFISTLANPANDASDMAAMLKRLGFEVSVKINATHREMENEILQFGMKLRQGGVGLFYYAGHGVQIDGRNYLIPVDADVISLSDIKFETVDAGRILGKMEDAGNGLNIIILDACRNNPFASKFRSADRGLAKMEAPTGSILAYATAPGSVAADGKGRNGLYTSKLLKYMQQANLSIEDCFKKVRVEVMAASEKRQVPWESSSLTADFFFVSAPASQAVTKKTHSSESVELMYWESIKDSKDIKLYQSYIDEFPNGAFVALAKLYIDTYSTIVSDIRQPVETREKKQPIANLPPPPPKANVPKEKQTPEVKARTIKLAFLPSLFKRDMLGIAPVKHQYDAVVKAIEKQSHVELVYAYWRDPQSDTSRVWKQRFLSASEVDLEAVAKYCADVGADVALAMKSASLSHSDSEAEVYLIDVKSREILYHQKSSTSIYNLLEVIESEVEKSIETLHAVKFKALSNAAK